MIILTIKRGIKLKSHFEANEVKYFSKSLTHIHENLLYKLYVYMQRDYAMKA